MAKKAKGAKEEGGEEEVSSLLREKGDRTGVPFFMYSLAGSRIELGALLAGHPVPDPHAANHIPRLRRSTTSIPFTTCPNTV